MTDKRLSDERIAELEALVQLTQSTPLTMGSSRVNVDRLDLAALLAELREHQAREKNAAASEARVALVGQFHRFQEQRIAELEEELRRR